MMYLAFADPVVEIINTPPQAGWRSPLALIPFITALITLGGVIATNAWTGRNMIKAEDVRHANGIVAEDKRHSNELSKSTYEWHRESRANLYFEMASLASQIFELTYQMIWYLRPNEGSGAAGAHFPTGASDSLLEAQAADITLRKKAAICQVIGSHEVFTMVAEYRKELREIRSNILTEARDADGSVPLDDPTRENMKEDHELRMAAITKAMREDLLEQEVGDPVPKDAPEDDSSTADLPEPTLNTP